MQPYVIRTPREGEGADIARVQNRAWEQAYGDLLPARFWDQEALAHRQQMWERALRRPDARSQIRLAATEGTVVGFASVGRPLDDDVDVQLQLYTCYVLAEHHGTGVAHRMISELLGQNSASLWVFEDNPRAVRFYHKHGFVADGASKDLGEEDDDDALVGIREIRMVRAKS